MVKESKSTLARPVELHGSKTWSPQMMSDHILAFYNVLETKRFVEAEE